MHRPLCHAPGLRLKRSLHLEAALCHVHLQRRLRRRPRRWLYPHRSVPEEQPLPSHCHLQEPLRRCSMRVSSRQTHWEPQRPSGVPSPERMSERGCRLPTHSCLHQGQFNFHPDVQVTLQSARHLRSGRHLPRRQPQSQLLLPTWLHRSTIRQNEWMRPRAAVL